MNDIKEKVVIAFIWVAGRERERERERSPKMINLKTFLISLSIEQTL